MDLDPEKQVPSKLAPTSELLTQQSTNGWGLVEYLWMNRWMNPKHPKKTVIFEPYLPVDHYIV